MAETEYYDILIVGAGRAGAHAAIAPRQRGHAGGIATISSVRTSTAVEESLAGDNPFARILLRAATFYADRATLLLPRRTIVRVDAEAYRVTTAGGEVVGYRTLIWATGGSLRRRTCAGHDLEGVHGVRTRADVDRMIAELSSVERVVVIGGGYISCSRR